MVNAWHILRHSSLVHVRHCKLITVTLFLPTRIELFSEHSLLVSHYQSNSIAMQDEFIVIGVTDQAGSWPVMLFGFPGCLDFQISESWMQTVNEFHLEALYLLDTQLPASRKALEDLREVHGD